MSGSLVIIVIESVTILGLGIYTVQLRHKIMTQKDQDRRLQELTQQLQTVTKVNDRLKGQIKHLNQDLSVHQNQNKTDQDTIAGLNQTITQLNRKIEQDRSWLNREQKSAQKFIQEGKILKVDLSAAQEQLATLHNDQLKARREKDALRKELSALKEEHVSVVALNRKLEDELQRLRQRHDNQRHEWTRFKKEYQGKKWVAQSEYLRVQKLLKKVQFQLNKIKSKSRPRPVKKVDDQVKTNTAAVKPNQALAVIPEPIMDQKQSQSSNNKEKTNGE